MIKNKEIVIDKIITAIKEEQKYITKANEIDSHHFKMKIEIKQLIEISELLKQENIEEKSNQDVILFHNGNPYISYILTIKAICNEINLKLVIQNEMLGTNLAILKVINEVLKELKIKTKIEIISNMKIEEIPNEKNSNLIVLGDNLKYSNMKKAKIETVKYLPKWNIVMYIQNKELEELKQDIIQYCYNQFIEIEIYEADDLDDFIEQIVADYQGEKVMILTKEKLDVESIRQKTGVPITVNTNILKEMIPNFIKEKIM